VIAPDQPSLQGFTARQRDSEVLFLGQRFVGSDDEPGAPKKPLDRDCADLTATMLGAAMPTKLANAADRS
jgi:hypothetical protein